MKDKKKLLSKVHLLQLVRDPDSILVWANDAITAPGDWRYCGKTRTLANVYAKKHGRGVRFMLLGSAESGEDVQFDVRPCVVCGKPVAAFVDEHLRNRPCTPCIKEQDDAEWLARVAARHGA